MSAKIPSGTRDVGDTAGGTATHPLSGLKVADFTRVLAGPYATMMLADFGADVIKIESPEGDETRHWLPPVDSEGNSTYFSSVNRNKRSLVCDLHSEEGLLRATELAESADIVIENFRPGVMRQFGLDWQRIQARNPKVVYCSITGFGPDASGRMPGYDLLVQAVGGLMSITGTADGPASKVGVAIVDVLTGLNAFSGILLAVRMRDAIVAENPGANASQLVEVNLFSTVLAALTNQASSTIATGSSPQRTGNAHPSIAPYEVFEAADREMVIAVGNDKQFRTLARLIGDEELARDDAFSTNSARLTNRVRLCDLLNERLRSRPAIYWVEALTDAGVPAGLINSISEAFDFAETLNLDPLVTFRGESGSSADRARRSVANPISLLGYPVDYALFPPRLGEHPQATWLDAEQSTVAPSNH
ncbi:MAG: CaiB/BaiF CoA transferase family protein [Microbacteriaceae bacterium]